MIEAAQPIVGSVQRDLRGEAAGRYLIVMNGSIYPGQAPEDAPPRHSGHGPGAEAHLGRLQPGRDGRGRFTADVEALAARWQAALGGFHHAGARPSR
jgi:hypothetical protein